MNQQKRTPGTGPRNHGTPHPGAPRKPQKGSYFDLRFMTDDEHVRHREKYIALGIIKPGACPTVVEKQTFYGPKGEKEVRDVVVVLKPKEETAAMRQDFISKGLIIPKDRRASRAGTA